MRMCVCLRQRTTQGTVEACTISSRALRDQNPDSSLYKMLDRYPWSTTVNLRHAIVSVQTACPGLWVSLGSSLAIRASYRALDTRTDCCTVFVCSLVARHPLALHTLLGAGAWTDLHACDKRGVVPHSVLSS